MDPAVGQLLPRNRIESWSASYVHLITDEAGVKYFRDYLSGDGSCDGFSVKMCKLLEFALVVHGYRSMQEFELMKKAARSIWKRFFSLKDLQSLLKRETFDRIGAFINSLSNPISDLQLTNAFNEAQEQVHQFLATTAYIAFVNSDYYLKLLDAAQKQSTPARANLPSYSQDPLAGPSQELKSNKFHANALLPPNQSASTPSNSSEPGQIRIKSNQCPSFKTDQVMNSCQQMLDDSNVTPAPVKSLYLPSTSSTHPATNSVSNSYFNDERHPFYNASFEGKPHGSFPPNPYHVGYSTVLLPSAQDSEIGSYSSGATRSDIASSTDERLVPSNRKIGSDQSQRDIVRHHLRANKVRGMGPNESEHFVRLPPPNALPTALAEKEPEKFVKILTGKLEKLLRDEEASLDRFRRTFELQSQLQRVSPYKNLAELSGHEGQAILDSHVRQMRDWGESPVDQSSKVLPVSQNSAHRSSKFNPSSSNVSSRILPQSCHLSNSVLAPQMSVNEKVLGWRQKDTSTSIKFKSSKPSTSKRGRGDGQSSSEFVGERPIGEGNFHESIIEYTYDGGRTTHRIRIPQFDVTLLELKKLLPKKGPFNYYCKVYDQIVARDVFDEITNDFDVLPNVSKDRLGYIFVEIRPIQ